MVTTRNVRKTLLGMKIHSIGGPIWYTIFNKFMILDDILWNFYDFSNKFCPNPITRPWNHRNLLPLGRFQSRILLCHMKSVYLYIIYVFQCGLVDNYICVYRIRPVKLAMVSTTNNEDNIRKCNLGEMKKKELNQSISVLLSKPILTLEFNSLKMLVEAPEIVMTHYSQVSGSLEPKMWGISRMLV